MAKKRAVSTVKKGEKNLGGRPKANLNTDQLYLLAQSMLPVESIAKIMGVHVDTIYARYSEILQKGRENRKYSLVQVMWHKALEEKDTKMLIWLSKQHLGYRDQLPEEAHNITFNIITNDIPK